MVSSSRQSEYYWRPSREELEDAWNCSRRLLDYSQISWSTFQPRDASSILENFRLVVLGDAWGLLVKAIKTTRNYPARLQSTRGLVVWTSLGPLPRWVPGPTTRWAPGTARLVPHGTWWRGAQGLRWRSTRIGSYTCPVLCIELLDVPDLYSLLKPTCNPASWTI
jgi:hypothetical protein